MQVRAEEKACEAAIDCQAVRDNWSQSITGGSARSERVQRLRCVSAASIVQQQIHRPCVERMGSPDGEPARGGAFPNQEHGATN